MITLYADNSVSINHTTVGRVRQGHSETEFSGMKTSKCQPSGEYVGLGKRIVLSAPNKAGWIDLEKVLIEKGLISV